MLATVRELCAVDDAAKARIDAQVKGRGDDGVAQDEAEVIRRELHQEKATAVLYRIRGWRDHEGKLVLPRSLMAAAIPYTLNQWDALCRYTQHGYLNIDNNAAERALKRVAIGGKNWLFAGNDQAGVTAATLYSLIASAERHGLDPQAYLTTVLAQIASTPVNQVGRFLPDTWHAKHLADVHRAQSSQPGLH